MPLWCLVKLLLATVRKDVRLVKLLLGTVRKDVRLVKLLLATVRKDVRLVKLLLATVRKDVRLVFVNRNVILRYVIKKGCESFRIRGPRNVKSPTFFL